MISTHKDSAPGRIASLHLHPREPGEPLQSVAEILVEAGKGIAGEPRYFGRISSTTGKPSLRQLSLIEREQLDEHATTLGLAGIDPGAARSNIETEGLQLGKLVGREVRVGEAVVRFYEPRKPCSKMDAICQGLRSLMEDGKQGVLAEIIQGGRIRVGDSIRLLDGKSTAS